MAERIQRVPEFYYSIAELTMLLRFSDTTIRRWIRDGRFSPGGDLSNVLQVGEDIRVPASGVNFFISSNPYRYDLGVKARNRGELQRKLAGNGTSSHVRTVRAPFFSAPQRSIADQLEQDDSRELTEATDNREEWTVTALAG